MTNSELLTTLKSIRRQVNQFIEQLDEEYIFRTRSEGYDSEEDDAPTYMKWAVQHLEMGTDELESAIHALEWQEMSLAEREEYYRHGVPKISNRVAL